MEIATAVGGALLSASVQPLIEKLTSNELNIFARREKNHADLKNWKMILAEINALLNDAEDKQMTNPVVKIWLDEFRDLTYDIEDVLDEFNTEVLKRKVMEDSHATTNKLRKFIPTGFTSFAFNNKMASRIKEITEGLERIKARQQHSLNLLTNATGTRSNQLTETPPTTSLVVPSLIYGREDEKEAIVQRLLGDEGGSIPFSVIPILGMGGIGKTTLAQLVYNDPAVKDYFDIKVWVCVSENFDVVGLTRKILDNVYLQNRDLKDLNPLQEILKEKLSQKKFLLILDDVWEEDYNLWDLLRRPFFSAASRSKIIVTTRKHNAAPITGDVHVYRVKELPDDECLSLLACHALGANSFDARPDLKDIGEKLVKRCDGLPLAAKVLGGLLRNKRSREEWEGLLKNKLWNSQETSNRVHPTLKLSYNDLPCHLKRCFVYCAIFPKDYEFDRDELVRLWMAEGFLQHPQGGMLMEDWGIECFKDLESRSLFQLHGDPDSPFFVMHDLISDLAQNIAKDICYNYETLKDDMSSLPYQKVRHASFSYFKYFNDSQACEIYTRMKSLRTILGFPICRNFFSDVGFFEYKMLYKLLAQSKCARVLSLTISNIRKLPNSIEDLIHLRYINLSNTDIEQLPESVSTLYNLQSLLLAECRYLQKLPDKIRNLVNLRHLDISETGQLNKLSSGIGMLTNLQTLSKFIVEEGDGTTIAELKNLNHLRGSLSIQGLENVEDAKLANLKGKQGLKELELKWNGHGKNDMSVLESLEPAYENLKRLTISSYGGAEFPSWMINAHSFPKLVSLKLYDCKEIKVLPPLGHLGGEGFPNLQELELYDCPKLTGNFPSGFPSTSLRKLKIVNCGNLLSLLDGLMVQDDNTRQSESESHLEELDIKGCQGLTSFPAGKLPASLIFLRIGGPICMQLESAISGKNTALASIGIEHCDNMKALPSIDCLPSLKALSISRCPALESFPIPKMGFLSTSLVELRIFECQNLSIRMQSHFPSLRSLWIRRCPNVGSLIEDGGLPRNLACLYIT